MSIRTLVVAHDSPVILVVWRTPGDSIFSSLFIHIGPGNGLPMRFKDRSYNPIVAEWRCPDRPEGPELHWPDYYISFRPAKGHHLVEPGDKVHITTMDLLFRRHVTIIERDGRLTVIGESDLFTVCDSNRASE